MPDLLRAVCQTGIAFRNSPDTESKPMLQIGWGPIDAREQLSWNSAQELLGPLGVSNLEETLVSMQDEKLALGTQAPNCVLLA